LAEGRKQKASGSRIGAGCERDLMAEEVRIWQVDKADALTEIKRSSLDREARIEKWILNDVSLLSPDLLIIGEQVETASGNFIDLLCIDRSGSLVIVELKRDMTPREVTAQALDYASWVKDLRADGIEEIAMRHLKEPLEDVFQSKFGVELPEVINEHHAMLVVASEIDDSTERIIRYLSETYGVDINAVRFQFFQAQDGHEFLIRTFTVAPHEVEQNIKRSGTKRTVLNPEEMAEVAREAGVGELFKQALESISQYLRPRWGKTVCRFMANLPDGRRNKVVFLLEPGGESSAENGLVYVIYSKRLAACLGIDEDTVLSHLPPGHERYEWQNAPEDLRGWAGHLRNNEDIQKIVDLVKNIERQNSTES
jgi:hypothetical protein